MAVYRDDFYRSACVKDQEPRWPLVKSQHGEGSRGGHIIGHTKSGAAIYAHHSVQAHEIKPLIDGDAYGYDHIQEHYYTGPNSLDPGRDIPLGNGHKLVFSTEMTEGPSYYPASDDGPEENNDAEFETDYKIVDKDNKPVDGAMLTPELEDEVEANAQHLSELAAEHYEPDDHYDPDDR